MRSMRVTVCFGQTRVIVPCKGGVTVAELVKEACARYKKAIGKSPKYFVKIRQLENAVDGGILDVDDYVYDVAEDRDQLIAVFEEEDEHSTNRNGWDHQSGSSSDGRRSPLSSYQRHPPSAIHRYSNDVNASRGNHVKSPTGKASIIRPNQRDQGLEIDVGLDALKSNTHITVRRGSDPMLNKVGNSDDVNEISSQMIQQNKSPSNDPQNYYGRRESGSGQEETEDSKLHNNIMITTASSPGENVSVMTASSDVNNSIESNHGDTKTQNIESNRQYGSGSNFVRGTTRQSVMGMLSEKYEEDFEQRSNFPANGLRQPPEGMKRNSSDYEDNFTGTYTSRFSSRRYSPPPPIDKSRFPSFYEDSQEMFIENDGSPLGLQVISYKDEKVFCGLMVKSVDVGGRAEREGLLIKGDIIVEINNYVLAQYSILAAQELFKDAMKYPDLQLRVYPVEERERSVVGNSDEADQVYSERRKLPVLSPAPKKKSNALSSAKSLPDLNSSIATFPSKAAQSTTASPNSKQPLIARMSYDTLSNNTKKIGNMFEIQLRKGEQGLGFSITTRDTAVGDPGMIYIKNILPRGAAIQDGRLLAGDRLLKVNGEEMTGHTQESAVSILRSIPAGSIVDLLISRHVYTLPRKLKDDPVADKVLSDDNQKEYFMFEIALNDTGSAGLGISLKGNQSKKTRRDLGIFVKSVFHGGAAYQDGRLRPNDQLVSVNGQSLVGMTNHESIDTLRSSMSTVGNVRGMIQMVIARRKRSSREPTSPRFSSEASSDLSDSLLNEQNSRHVARPRSHHRQVSMPSLRSGAVSPRSRITHGSYSDRQNHYVQESEISCASSVFSTSLGDDTDWYNNDTFYPVEEEERLVDGSYTESRASCSPPMISSPPTIRHSRKSTLTRHSSLRLSKDNGNENHFANVINRYTQSRQSNSSYRNIIGDLLKSAAVDKSYKPKVVGHASMIPSPKLSMPHSAKKPTRSLSMRSYKSKVISDKQKIPSPKSLPRRHHGTAPVVVERSEFDNLTAYEITGPAKEDYYSEQHMQRQGMRYMENMPHQIDPNPVLDNRDRYYDDSRNNSENWPPSPGVNDEDAEPFSRESVYRQSISEKRRGGGVTYNSDTYKGIKNKQQTAEIEKQKPPVDPKKLTPLSSPKWLKPANTKNARSGNSTPTHSSGMRYSPSADARNQNNSNSFSNAREEHPVRPGIEVGPTLGIAKSSSLESLQTAVENFVDNAKNPDKFPKAKVLRGRVLNESFRAALDHSYDLDKVNGKPMETLREEGGSHLSSLVTSSENSVGNMRQKTHEKKRAGKSYKIFGIFRVKGKRSASTDRALDQNSGSSVSSASSSPYLPESEVHKRHLQSKRQDDYKKHLEETGRIQAKAKEMREQQEKRRKHLEKKLSKDEVVPDRKKIQEERVRAPSVPVTAMQNINLDPKKTYSEMPSGRHSVDPLAMRGHQSQINVQNFEWHPTKKTPVSSDRTKTQETRGRPKVNEKKKIHPLDNTKSVPDYSSLPRQPSYEPKAELPSDRTPNSAVTQPNRGRENMRSPTSNYSGTLNMTGRSGFNNYQFYNMQKPPSSGRPKAGPSLTGQTLVPGIDETNNQSSRVLKSKAGRTLYYDDTDSSVSPSSTFRENSRNISGDRYNSNTQPRRQERATNNGFDPASTENFHREESPEPPPLSNHVSSKPRHSTAAVVKMRDRRRAKQVEENMQAYRHSVHVDTPATRDYYRIRNPQKSSGQKHPTVPPTFKWRTELQKTKGDHSDSDNSYRTLSPASSGTIERNRDAYNKVFRPRHNDKRDVERIVVSPPYNL